MTAARSWPSFPLCFRFRIPVIGRDCLISGPYLISGRFMGSHRTREGNARRPPSLIYGGIPLGVPRGESCHHFARLVLRFYDGKSPSSSLAPHPRIPSPARLPCVPDRIQPNSMARIVDACSTQRERAPNKSNLPWGTQWLNRSLTHESRSMDV